jgi:hypothetical protein
METLFKPHVTMYTVVTWEIENGPQSATLFKSRREAFDWLTKQRILFRSGMILEPAWEYPSNAYGYFCLRAPDTKPAWGGIPAVVGDYFMAIWVDGALGFRDRTKLFRPHESIYLLPDESEYSWLFITEGEARSRSWRKAWQPRI